MPDENMSEAVQLSDDLIKQIRVKATGSTMHPVCGLIGAYRTAVRLIDEYPNERQRAEMAEYNGAKLLAFLRTGDAGKLH